MIETATVAGSALKITCPIGELVRQLGIVSRAASPRTTVQVLARILLRSEVGSSSSRRPTWRSRCERGSMRRWRPKGRSSCPEAARRPGAPASRRRGLDRAPPGRRSRRDRQRRGGLQDPPTTRRTFPAYPTRPAPRWSRSTPRRCSRLRRRSVAQRRATSPGPSSPNPRSLRGENLVMAATDSYRLAVKKETSMAGPGPDLVDRARPGAARACACGPRRVGAPARPQENQVLFASDGVLLTTRRIEESVPQLPPAAPRELRVRGGAPARRAAGRGPPRCRHGPAQRAAAPAVRRGRADRLSADTDVGEAHETLPVPFSGEALDIGFNPEFLRDGIESVEETSCG